MGSTEEQLARDLASQLTTPGFRVKITGAAVECRLDDETSRHAVFVHCMHCRTTYYTGPEYDVSLHDPCNRVAEGRTRLERDAIAAVRMWLADTPLDELVREIPFIDEKPRAMRAITREIPADLRWELGPSPLHELRIYGDGRSCIVTHGAGDRTWAFRHGQVVIAHAPALSNVPTALSAWLLQRVPVTGLPAHVPEAVLGPHVEHIETDPARWRWLTMLDNLGPIAHMRGLLDALAVSPVASRFYPFSSMDRLCFSASSSYPWVTEGLPVVRRDGAGTYFVDGAPCDESGALRAIEARLTASGLAPFFGTQELHHQRLLTAALQDLGSSLEPHVVQHEAWHRLEVRSGTRRCTLSGKSVDFTEGAATRTARFESLTAAALIIRDFLERGVPLEEVAPPT